MLDRIWHLRGTVTLDERESDEAILQRVESYLKKQRKPPRRLSPRSIGFYSPLWGDLFGPNWLAMVLYDQGRVWIERTNEQRLFRYDLRSLHGLVFCLCASLLFFLFGMAAGWSIALRNAAFAFTWLYGGNMLLAHARIPGAMDNMARPKAG